MNDILNEAKSIEPELIQLRRELHQCPEIGMDLPQTRSVIRRVLTGAGLDAADCAGSLTLMIGNPEAGRTVLIRADMDGLPMEEKSELPFSSKNGACHACGHDMHAAMLYGACLLLKKHENKLHGAVCAVFQCAEETAEGAKALVKAGILSTPKIDSAFALHVQPELPSGMINATPGWKMKSYDRFRIIFTGQGGHGGAPHKSKDPIRAAVHLYSALEALQYTACAPQDEAVLSVGQLHGGTTANVIPETAFMEGTIRCRTQEGRTHMMARVHELCNGIGDAFGINVRTEWQACTPPLYNDPELAKKTAAALCASGLSASCDPMPMLFSEDFAEIASKVPTVYLSLGARESEEIRYNHDPGVRYDEKVMSRGAAILALCAMSELA